jgi:hypothetical protein
MFSPKILFRGCTSAKGFTDGYRFNLFSPQKLKKDAFWFLLFDFIRELGIPGWLTSDGALEQGQGTGRLLCMIIRSARC